MAKIAQIICQKKSHAKSFHPISPILNQINLHIGRLLLIQFGAIWSKIVVVTLFFLQIPDFLPIFAQARANFAIKC